jgi:hypothetical protein
MKYKLYKKVRNRIKKLEKNKLKIFIDTFKNSDFILKMLNDKDIYKLYIKDTLLSKFLNRFCKFINIIDIKQIEKEGLVKISEIAFNMLLVYYKFLVSNKIVTKNINESNRNNFLISSVRIIEFILFIAYKKDKMKRIFFDKYQVDSNKQYFFYLKDLDEIQKINYFAIYKENKTKQNKIVVGFNKEDCKEANKNNEKREKILENSFKSSIKTQKFEKEDINYFDHYFHLNNKTVKNIYNFVKVKSISRGKGGSRRIDKKDFVVIEENKFDIVSFSTKNISTFNLSDEIKIEIKSENINKIISPMLNKKTAKLIKSDELVNKPEKVQLDSSFKRWRISRAITNAIAKNNLNTSKYHLLEIEQLKEFFIFLYKKDKLKSDLILLQILLNSNLDKIINGFINQNITFNDKEKKLEIEYGNFFSILKDEVNIFKKVKKNKRFYIYISESMYFILKDFKKNIIDDISILYQKQLKEELSQELREELKRLIIKGIIKEIKTFLVNSMKEFNKKIFLNIQTLPKLSFYYFKKFKQVSSINMLFTKDINKNDEAKLCYCATTQRLFTYENWLLELLNILEISKIKFQQDIENITPNIYKTEDKIGSYKIIERGSFKNFLLDLEKLYYEDDVTKEDKINIQMIYLRYVLGLLLATRDFNNSCNLSNYSKRFKVLILQEKAKSIYMSKRMIPLTPKAIEYIEIFKKIKEKNKINSNSPILLIEGKEKTTNKSEMRNFFSKFKDKHEYVKYILYFIEYCKLNFGRHLVTYYFVNDNIKDNYLDAFLNHFSMGNEDQGIYSYFNNQEYFNTIIEKMKEIEQDYLRIDNLFKEKL